MRFKRRAFLHLRTGGGPFYDENLRSSTEVNQRGIRQSVMVFEARVVCGRITLAILSRFRMSRMVPPRLTAR